VSRPARSGRFPRRCPAGAGRWRYVVGRRRLKRSGLVPVLRHHHHPALL